MPQRAIGWARYPAAATVEAVESREGVIEPLPLERVRKGHGLGEDQDGELGQHAQKLDGIRQHAGGAEVEVGEFGVEEALGFGDDGLGGDAGASEVEAGQRLDLQERGERGVVDQGAVREGQVGDGRGLWREDELRDGGAGE